MSQFRHQQNPIIAITLAILILFFSSQFEAAHSAESEGTSPFDRHTEADLSLLPTRGTPAASVARAWELARISGTYRYQSSIEQTTHLAPKLTNAGRPPTLDSFNLSGLVDQPADLMELTMSQSGQRGIDLRFTAGTALARNPQGDWEEIEDFSTLFAPGGDPFLFLSSVDNVTAGERRQITFGQAAAEIDVTPYHFDINGPRYADALRRTLESEMQARGELPQGAQLESLDAYKQLTGSGELWVDGDGLPLQMQLSLDLGVQENGERITAEMMSQFSDFNREAIAAATTSLFENPSIWFDYRLSGLLTPRSAGIGLLSIVSLVTFVFFTRVILLVWRRRWFYNVIALSITLSMLITPFLQINQVHASYSGFHERQNRIEQLHTEANGREEIESAIEGEPWNPHADPLASTPQLNLRADGNAPIEADSAFNPNLSLQQTSTLTDTTDTDSDGLFDWEEDSFQTCSGAATSLYCDGVTNPKDSDGDGLSDEAEINALNLTPTNAINPLGLSYSGFDTDGDGISDGDEVRGFAYNNQMWYLDPSSPDTNRDGVLDTVECVQRSSLATNYDGDAICPDTDGDGVPDPFDYDDDNDGVQDGSDLSRTTQLRDAANPYTSSDRFSISVDNLTIGEPVFVDWQFRPANPDHLSYINNILDWPSSDDRGNITRLEETTYATTANAALRSSAPNAALGDMQLIPLVRMTIPYTAGHCGNLPVDPAVGCPADATDLDPNSWLDNSLLDPYGVTVRNTIKENNSLELLLLVSPVTDFEGGGRTAFSARMLYSPAATWGSAHSMELIWLVQMLVSSCTDLSDSTTCQDSNRVVHIYEDDYFITGLQVREDYGFQIAILGEDPSTNTDSSLRYDDNTLNLATILSLTFIEGLDCYPAATCTGNGQRDVDVAEIVRRFDSQTNLSAGVTLSDTWNMPLNSFQVISKTYPHEGFVAHVTMTDTVAFLGQTYAGYETQTNPSLLFAKESRSKTLNLEEMTPSDSLVGDLANVITVTEASMNLTPYRYSSSRSSWENFPIAEYWTYLGEVLAEQPFFQPADPTNGYQATVADGKIFTGRNFYLTLNQGLTSVVEYNGQLQTELASNFYSKWNLDPYFSGQWTTLVLDLAYTAVWGRVQYSTEDALYKIATLNGRLKQGDGVPDQFARGLGTKASRVTVAASLIAVTSLTVSALATQCATTKCDFAKAYEIVANGLGAAITSAQVVAYVARVSQVFTGLSNLSKLAQLQNIAVASRSGTVVGLIVSIVIVWGFAIYGLVKAKDRIERNATIAYAVASTIVVIVLFAMLFIPIIGPFLVLLITLFDTITFLVCEIADSKSDICKGITGIVTQTLAQFFYDVRVNELINFDNPNRLDFSLLNTVWGNGNGLVAGQTVSYTLGIKNSLFDRNSTNSLTGGVFESAFSYNFSRAKVDQSAQLELGAQRDRWNLNFDLNNPVNTRIYQTTQVSTDQTLNLQVGINTTLEPLYLNESFVVPYEQCDLILKFIEANCELKPVKGNIPFEIGREFVFDVLPATLTEFYTLVSDDGGTRYRLGWSPNFPALKDADGDGLLNRVAGGADLDDSRWDSDGDGLSDSYEGLNALDPLDTDTDDDGLSDGLEVTIRFDPRRADRDGDGLNDGQEWAGWTVSYADLSGTVQTTLVRANPNAADEDADGLTDPQEKIYGFHPNLAAAGDATLDAVTFNDAIVNESAAPELLLRFENRSGATVFEDGSGAEHSASCSSPSCPTAGQLGRYGTGLSFDGVDDYVAVSDDEALDFKESQDFTIAFWVKPDENQIDLVNPDNALIEKWSGTEPTYPYVIRYLNQSSADHGKVTVARYQAIEGNTPSITSNQTINDGQFHHVAFVKQGAELFLYIDGVLDGSTTDTTTRFTANSSDLYIGQRGSGINRFAGLLDEIVLLSQGLSAEDVQRLMAGRYNVDDLIVRPGDQLLSSVTINNNLPGRPAEVVYYGRSDGQLFYNEAPPLARFPFDEAGGATTFVDVSGNNHTAACNPGECPTAGIPGVYGTAVDFDGLDDHLSIDSIVPSLSESFTIGGWVFIPAANDSNQGIWGVYDNATPAQTRIGLHYTGYSTGFLRDNLLQGPGIFYSDTALGSWHHVISSYDAKNGIGSGYIDGQLHQILAGSDEGCFGCFLVFDNSGLSHFRIGDTQTWPARFYDQFHGYIDDFVVYDRYLNLNQVQALQAGQQVTSTIQLTTQQLSLAPQTVGSIADTFTVPTTASSGTFSLTLTAEAAVSVDNLTFTDLPRPVVKAGFDSDYKYIDNLFAGERWRLDGNIFDNPNDPTQIGNGRLNIQCANPAGCPAFIEDFSGSALSFDGIANQAEMSFYDALIQNQPWSISFWVKPTFSSPAAQGRPIMYGPGAPYIYFYSDSNIFFAVPRAGGGHAFLNSSTGVASFTPNEWNHIVLTFDGIDTYQEYTNGIPQGAETVMSISPLFNVSPANPMLLGADNNSASTRFEGLLDGIAIYDQTLSAEQVQYLSTQDPGLLAHYTFDDAPGSTSIADQGLFAGPLTCSGESCPAFGIRSLSNRAAQFDGNDLLLGADPFQNRIPNEEFTVAAWINMESGQLFEMRSTGTPFRLYQNRMNVGYSDSRFYYGNGMAWDSSFTNQWAHLVMTVKPDKTSGQCNASNGCVKDAVIYLDGVEILRDDNTLLGTPGSNIDQIFNDIIGVGLNAQGYIDDLRWYDYYFDANAVEDLYRSSVSVLQFEFEEGSDISRLTDSSPNAVFGSPVGGTQIGLPGRIGSGLSLNGSGYVELNTLNTNQTIGGLQSNYSMMAWIKPDDVGPRQRIIAASRDNSADGFGFGIDQGRLLFTTYGHNDYLVPSATVKPGVWQHVMVVFDSANHANFYQDGQLIARIAPAVNLPTTPNTDDPYRIGASTALDGSGAIDEPFIGQIDELHVFQRAIGSDEALRTYLNQFRWYRNQYHTALRIDADPPNQVALRSDYPYRANVPTILDVVATDAQTTIQLLDFGVRRQGDANFSWQAAPACAENVEGAATSFCPTFDPTQLGGEGVYELQFRAVDGVGGQALSPLYTLFVDGTPPSATSTYSDSRLDPIPDAEIDGRWTVSLSGSLSDPGQMTSSGLVTSTVEVALIGGAETLTLGRQPVSANGSSWSASYVIDGFRPTGRYAVELSAEDLVGNRITQAVGTILLDETSPTLNMNRWQMNASQTTLPITHIITSGVPSLSGLALDTTFPSELFAFHFEELDAAGTFFDSGPNLNHARCTPGVGCPIANGGTSRAGNVAQFNGTGATLLLSNPSELDMGGSFAFWVNPSAGAGGNGYDPVLLSFGNGEVTLSLDNQYGGLMMQTITDTQTISFTTPFVAGEWHHLTVVFQPDGWTGYVDGQLIGSALQQIPTMSNPDLRIGADANSGRFVTGGVDDLLHFRQRLNPNQIYALADQTASGISGVDIWVEPYPFTTTLGIPNWVPATLLGNAGEQQVAWEYPLVNVGETDGYYRVHLRSSDVAGNLAQPELLYAGIIDRQPPRITLNRQSELESSGLTFTVEDHFLDINSIGNPCGSSSPTLTETRHPISDDLLRVDGSCTLDGSAESVSLSACDLFGQCQTATLDTTIVVAPFAAGINSGDGCSLAEAIINANDDAATHPDCPAGSGVDTIRMLGFEYEFTALFDPSAQIGAALPDITSPIILNGNGATLFRQSSSPRFRFFVVRGDGHLILNDMTLFGGYPATPFGEGGAIIVYENGRLTLNRSSLSQNQSDSLGGALYLSSGQGATLNESRVSRNSSNGSFGGGIAAFTPITISRSTFSQNGAASGGGLFYGGPALTVENSTFSGNTAATDGGGLYLSGTAVIDYATFTGNTAPDAGGILAGGPLTLNRSLITGNGSEIDIRSGGTFTGGLNLIGDSSLTTAQAVIGGSLNPSDLSAASDGTNPTPLTSILETTLSEMGGNTPTHALVDGSPAVDQIASCPASPTVDQRGVGRPQGAACDIGAYEMEGSMASLSGSVSFAGRGAPPSAQWSEEVTVRLYSSGSLTPTYAFTTTTDTSGSFTLSEILPGSYTAAVKVRGGLQVVQSITLEAGSNSVDFGIVAGGDANGDNVVSLVDFSILSATFNLAAGDTDYDSRADFNGDGQVTALDFSILASNFNVNGEVVGD
ncbi:MAG: LamG-like jellyroll fold domain-containing protein [Chloroflexota bacterium]